MSVPFTTRRSTIARSRSAGSNRASRVQSPMWGDAGSCAWSPPICSVPATTSRSARSNSSWRARVARLSWRAVSSGCAVRAVRAVTSSVGRLEVAGTERGDQLRIARQAPLIPDRPEAGTGQAALIGEEEFGARLRGES